MVLLNQSVLLQQLQRLPERHAAHAELGREFGFGGKPGVTGECAVQHHLEQLLIHANKRQVLFLRQMA
ncbi:hypothetical protein SDC9_187074 [bioreactor metagenome]|uniref:Uncharacterized protein n=1 Tax=bioreactor metagenome TaxID=1076179 RepID=A0A645HLX9_9ZZZZ